MPSEGAADATTVRTDYLGKSIVCGELVRDGGLFKGRGRKEDEMERITDNAS